MNKKSVVKKKQIAKGFFAASRKLFHIEFDDDYTNIGTNELCKPNQSSLFLSKYHRTSKIS